MQQAPVWARQPRIRPNYNLRKFKRFPQNMANQMRNVLLHSNVTEENKLEARRRQLSSQRASSMRSGHLHRQAFIVRQIMQEMQLEAIGAKTTSLLPKHLVKEHRHLAMFHNFFYMGGKDLPMHHRLDRFFLKSLQNAQINREVVQKTYTVQCRRSDDNRRQRMMRNNALDELDAPATTSATSDAHPAAVLRSLTSDALPTGITTSVRTKVQVQPATDTDVVSDISPTGDDQLQATDTKTCDAPAPPAAAVANSVTLATHPKPVTRSVTFDRLPTVVKKSTIFNTEPRLAHRQSASRRGTEHLPSIFEHPKNSAATHKTANAKSTRRRVLLPRDGQQTSMAARGSAEVLGEKTTAEDPRFSRLEKLLRSSQSMPSFQKASLRQDALGKTQSLERIILPGSTRRYPNVVKPADIKY